ncbi:hypothetical protein BU24DRAFT_475616 [Aaosphaeria arxii CBS 175.79]|uniref:Uncharacterized protein n=1 Tax=Aaosphaeria arxii CBS 175.79 TaxID=1450172 RepID=A0A6A5Y0D9_9PLEO|nr:uncharacterized protein BU24DRAFT_475616 [Aaosphaeria arxii CBS 175.79]KAF2018547.1 hypothetical protein BU24DRAFT_475616 [Aaosphaeria arxii CBS 175.79]
MSAQLQSGIHSHDAYVGFWTNWSSGKIQGATVTLTRRNGGLLVAFLALFVATAGRSFWRIICFMLHCFLSKPSSPQDGLYHQRQALLRNNEAALSAAWQLLEMMVVWKKSFRSPMSATRCQNRMLVPIQFRTNVIRHGICKKRFPRDLGFNDYSKAADKVYRRLLPITAAAITISVCFTIAGIFSSNVTTNDGNEILLTGRNCGILDLDTILNNITLLDAARSQDARRAQGFFDYVRTCYGEGNTAGTDRCRFYVKPRLALQVDSNAPCPFTNEICHSTTGNLRLDTGYINIHEDLGINAPPKDRFSLRIVHQCAPLKADGYTTIETEIDRNNSNVPVNFTRVYYGSWNNMNFPEYKNYTFQKGMPYTRTMSKYSLGLDSDYELGFVEAYQNNSLNRAIRFEPIPQLLVPNADLALYFLSAPYVVFQNKVDDPWFSAHGEGPMTRNLATGKVVARYFTKDAMISTVGCTTQQQICNPNTGKSIQPRCEELRGEYMNYQQSTSKLWDTDSQRETFEWVYSIFKRSRLTMINLVQFAGPTALAARHSLFSGNQGVLPSNQWQIEMENIVSASLASLQDVFADASEGPPTAKLHDAWRRPESNNTAAKRACQNQKLISTKFFSFSVLGLSLILSLGAIFIILEFCLEPVIGQLHKSTYSRPRDIEPAENIQNSSNPADKEFKNRTRQIETLHAERRVTDLSRASTQISLYDTMKAARHMEWNSNSTFQLQRLAHDGIGCGTWERTSSNVPVTRPNQTLAMIGIRGPSGRHLCLVSPDKIEIGEEIKK